MTTHERVDASPTKAFFIEMLVRDVTVARSIIDVIDNCVDGAIRGGLTDLSAYWVRLALSKTSLEVSDNCGGIPLDIAKHYAFRFGRPDAAPTTPNSIGQFGVGMKRTIFKLGSAFSIESTTSTSRLKIVDNVDEWKLRDEWNFELSEVEEGPQQADAIGTTLKIEKLHPTVSEMFALENFVGELRREIEAAHANALNSGLAISVNGTPLGRSTLELLQSESLKPTARELVFKDDSSTDEVNVRLYAGIAKDRSLTKGGWYIFCNGRMVVEADQSRTTGWNDLGDGGVAKYHADFAFFRGYAFFDSSNARLLPWTTTKTGVEEDSAIYRAARLEMIAVAKPVLEFLRKLSTETQRASTDPDAETPLASAMQEAQSISHVQIPKRQPFAAPAPAVRPPQPALQRIQYDRPKKLVDLVMRQLKVKTYKAVGEKTFDYYKQMECDLNE